jgi:hypothetical protein
MPDNPSPFDPALVWVHVGSPDGDQLHMLRLSALSAHCAHPHAQKVCLVPRGVEREIATAVEDLRDRYGCFLEVRAASVPKANTLIQSRWLKIKLATIIGRDCLFVDSDTLFVRPLDFSCVPPSPIAAAINQDGTKAVRHSSEQWVKELFTQCGWDWPSTPAIGYLNTGVIAYRSGPDIVEFSNDWMRNWDHFESVTHYYYDQIAFNRTSFDTGLVGTLPETWNAPVGVLPQTACSANIFHYYASVGNTWGGHTLWGSLIDADRRQRLPKIASLKHELAKRRPFVGLGASAREYRAAKQWRLYAITVVQDKARALRRRLLERSL